jgi:hypothetical protein
MDCLRQRRYAEQGFRDKPVSGSAIATFRAIARAKILQRDKPRRQAGHLQRKTTCIRRSELASELHYRSAGAIR